jgi:hypothetical protein
MNESAEEVKEEYPQETDAVSNGEVKAITDGKG